MHRTKITILLALLAFQTVGNFASGSMLGGAMMGGILVVSTYLAFVSRSAEKTIHFTIARYLTISGITVAIFLIVDPIIREILGGFGDFLSIVVGMTLLFPILVFREAIMHRKKLLSEAEADPVDHGSIKPNTQ